MNSAPVPLAEQLATVERVYQSGGRQPIWRAVLATLQHHERAMAALRKIERILVEDTNALDHPCCGWGPTLAMVRAVLDATNTAGDAG